MNARERQRLAESVRLGDTEALWKLWRELERGVEAPGWQIGTLPNPEALVSSIRRLRGIEYETHSYAEDAVTLFYIPETDSWSLVKGPQQWFGIPGPWGTELVHQDFGEDLFDNAANLISEVWDSIRLKTWQRRPGYRTLILDLQNDIPDYQRGGFHFGEIPRGRYFLEVPPDYPERPHRAQMLLDMTSSIGRVRVLRGPMYDEAVPLPQSAVEVLSTPSWWLDPALKERLRSSLSRGLRSPLAIRFWLLNNRGRTPIDHEELKALRETLGYPELNFIDTEQHLAIVTSVEGSWLYQDRKMPEYNAEVQFEVFDTEGFSVDSGVETIVRSFSIEGIANGLSYFPLEPWNPLTGLPPSGMETDPVNGNTTSREIVTWAETMPDLWRGVGMFDKRDLTMPELIALHDMLQARAEEAAP